MFDNIRLTAIGVAAVLDAVLLIALIERPNRRRVATWMWWMIGSTLVFHAGGFIHHLVAQADTPWALHIDRASMTCMAFGLLVLPAAMLHGCLRLVCSGLDLDQESDWRFALLYLPVLMIVPIAGLIKPDQSRDFLTLVSSVRRSYTVYFLVASICTAVGFLLLRNRVEFKNRRGFLLRLAVTFIASAIALVAGVWIGLEKFPRAAPLLTLAMTMLPAITVILVLYQVVRFGLFQVLLERSMVYGAILVGFLLFHRVVFTDFRDQLSDQFRVDFAIIEGVAAISLILLYAPFRQRVSEGLRYLTGSRVDKTRSGTRELSARMTQLVGQPTPQLLGSVAESIREAFDIEVRILLHAPEACGVPQLPDTELEQTRWLSNRIRGRRQPVTVWSISDGATLERMDELEAAVAISLDHGEVSGVMLTGAKPGNQRVSEEELNALVLLADQLAVTLQLERLQAQRIATERRAIQQEKLSTLGLLAGSIAHEIRNPLSSMKAITSVMAEDLGPDSEHSDDLKLILGEIDRLSSPQHRYSPSHGPNHRPSPPLARQRSCNKR